MLWNRTPPTRAELLAVADKARSRGRLRKAIDNYQRALALEPGDTAVHGKLAPLLARAKQPEAALTSFEAAAQGYLQRGFMDKAVATYVVAAGTFPLRVQLWERVAELQLERGRRGDAVKALLTGRSHLRRKERLAEAIALLERALALDATLFEPRLDLALLLARAGRREEGLGHLEALLSGATKARLRKVRARQLRLAPSPGAAWRWLRAALLGR